MESITKVSMSVCPFVRSTSTQALRQLSQTSGALANQARQCPIAGNAIRAKEISIRSYSSATKPVRATAATPSTPRLLSTLLHLSNLEVRKPHLIIMDI